VDPVPGGTTVIGSAVDAISNPGLTLTNVTGTLNFADIDIYTDSGAALNVNPAGAFTLTATAHAGTLVANAGSAAIINSTTVDLQLNSLISSTSAGTGVSLTLVTGTFSAPSGSSISNALGTDFNCQNALQANLNTGGSNNPATNPPFVNVFGTVNVTATQCQQTSLN
jgi:hypothetical protein